MNSEIKNKWIKALRSGEYKQGEGVLHNQISNTYCCLGVLCQITNVPRYEDNVENVEVFGIPEHYSKSYVPSNYANDFGLSFKSQEELAKYNDELGWDFNEIADWIEKSL
jgi:hypothetical protein